MSKYKFLKVRKTAVAYARTGTNTESKTGLSVKSQLAEIKEFAEKNNYVILEEYSDEGKSGFNMKRPALKKLLSDAKPERQFGAVIVYDQSRLTRRKNHNKLITNRLKKVGVDLVFVRQNDIHPTVLGQAVLASIGYKALQLAPAHPINK